MSDTARRRMWLAGILVLVVIIVSQFMTIRGVRIEAEAARADAVQLRTENERLREIPRRRGEMVETGRWLHEFYKSDEGLKRPQGLWIGDQPDFEGIGAWLLDVYLSERIAGATEEAARLKVVDTIQQTEEWRNHHPAP